MPAVKTARSSVSAICVDCPHCDTPVEDPERGSFMLTHESIDRLGWRTAGGGVKRAYTCSGCKRTVRIPALAAQVAR